MNHILIAVVKPRVQKREIKHKVCLRIWLIFGSTLVIKTPFSHLIITQCNLHMQFGFTTILTCIRYFHPVPY